MQKNALCIVDALKVSALCCLSSFERLIYSCPINGVVKKAKYFPLKC